MNNFATDRLGEEKYNSKNCLMKIIEYIDRSNVTVEFQDEYKAKVKSNYYHFYLGNIKNPYLPTVYGVGIVGNKYPSRINKIRTKEYTAWTSMLKRCFDKKIKLKNPTYKDAVCCDEWLLYDNFYEWIHKQENFEQWLKGCKWNLDKDIIKKGNKVYSPENCCLVPHNVNGLFTKCDAKRGNFPIGVSEHENGFLSRCNNPIINKEINIGIYSTPFKAFDAYKNYKENLIKQVAKEEYNKRNITNQCYNAMMSYEVEITD